MQLKTSLFSIVFMLSILNGIGQVRANKDLIGKWNASTLQLEFFPDGRLFFSMRGGSIPGARYKTDFAQNPALLNIELVQKAQKIIYKSKIEFIDDNSFRLTALDNDPSHAFDKQRSIVLRKVK